MPTSVKEEKWELNRTTSGISESTLAQINYVALTPQSMWEYPVPVGESLVFTGEDTYSLYALYAAAETVAASRMDIVVKDADGQNTRNILNETRYGNLKEFQDADKLCHLDISAGEQVIVREGERVCLRFRKVASGASTELQPSVSYFRLTCKRIRHTLFE